MGDKLPKEFWDWVRDNGLHPRGPRGSPINQLRAKQMGRLIAQWKREHKEVSLATGRA